MKIAIIRKKYTFHGGAEGFSSSLIEKLADEGHEIHIYAIKWESDQPNGNVYFHKVPVISFVSFLRDLTFAVSTFFLLRRKRSYFDIIQTHDKTLYQDIYRAGDGCHIEWLQQRWKRTGLAGKVSMILNPYHWLILGMEKMIFTGHRFSKVIAISEMVKRNVMQHYGVSPNDIEVIYNGVDLHKFNPANREKHRSEIRGQYNVADSDFVVLFVGSGFERKGVKYLIKAVEASVQPVTLLIVGKGSASEFRSSASQRIIFCGPQTDVYKYYAAADIFAFPTMYEPFGNVHLEALASGLPVITTRNSGAAEIIKDGEHGFVIENPEDVDALTDRINNILTHSAQLDNMRSNARTLAEEFSFEKHMTKIRELYENVR